MRIRISKQSTFLVGMIVMLITAAFVWAVPSGPDAITEISNQRYDNAGTKSLQALAGNVSNIDLSGTTITKFWQGYYGDVTGTIVLGNALNFTLYQWASNNPEGEIYASRIPTIAWDNNIECANDSTVRGEDTFVGSITNASGGDVDTVNLTMNKTTHPAITVGSHTFTNCRSTSVNAAGNGNIFWEVLLQENATSPVTSIYSAIIAQNTVGFDGSSHDFQMIVPEPGSGTEAYPNGVTTTYYFFVELG